MFLVHDINFHRSVAAASGNPIVASLVEMVSALYYERRRDTAAGASQRDLRDAAEAHRRIYQAIRARNPDGARQAMHAHLLQAADYQSQESTEASTAARPGPVLFAAAAPPPCISLMSIFDLSGRTAVVVGGTSGIGRVLALGLADAGADVVVTGRRADRIDEVAAEIRAARPADADDGGGRRGRGVARAPAGSLPHGARRGPHHDLRGRRHQARRDPGDGRGGVEPHHRHQPDRHACARARCSAGRWSKPASAASSPSGR